MSVEDSKILEEYRTRNLEIARRIIATTDLTERVHLMSEHRLIMDEVLNRVSDESRPFLKIAIKIMIPFQQEGQAYTEKAGAFFNDPDNNFDRFRSRDDIQRSIAGIKDLSTLNTHLITRLNAIETDIETEMNASSVKAADRRNFMAGFRNGFGRTIGPARAIRSLDNQLYDCWLTLYDLLDTEWSHWTVMDDGTLNFERSEAADKFNLITTEINVLSERQSQAEAAYLSRL